MVLQFHSWASAVEAPFWQVLTQRKMDVFKLDDSLKSIFGYYATGHQVRVPGKDATVALPARLCLGTGAFPDVLESEHASTSRAPAFTYPAPGLVKNTNTIEDFKSIDRTALFKMTVDQIWEDITSGKAVLDPSLLNKFLLLTFADLKKFKFFYWFAFPALVADPAWTAGAFQDIGSAWSQTYIQNLHVQLNRYRETYPLSQHGFFLIKESSDNSSMSTTLVARLQDWDTFYAGCNPEQIVVGFADPSSLDSNPGWPLRNFLTLLYYQWRVSKVRVLCFREVPGKQDISASKIFTVEVPSYVPLSTCPKAVGWEKNAQGKLGPRLADLAPLMDPTRLADTAVDLNLKLMRWRLLPDLQLEKVQETRCLLLGAGTLGCYVARSLLGWGIRNITLVDNAKVSFSNPVRQPLFEFEDCLEGGKDKAITAAASLRKVYPGVNAVGHTLSIPMPGHPISPQLYESVQRDVEKLEDLFQQHDVIFLLMDSRESRWLPTLLGARMKKIVINAALGFDTFLVMRHGIGQDHEYHASFGSSPLGCYFCNDVVAPTDSLSDRTLDQQCTVTRPGLSAIASAVAVEMLVSLLHHPDGMRAPADKADDEGDQEGRTQNNQVSTLGLLPHQIRGFLSRFKNLLISGQAYDRCTACSDAILEAYEKEGFGFLAKVFQDAKHLEDVTGLTQMKEQSEELNMEWDEDSDEDI
ncbi:Autophagy protein 7 [Lobosporangium transversale]|uniref:Ubiquitin-like modifier-activating enzyme ATG7 n=1 Tax=Lobosporangium transversale TaxID=64571 RepID=A0A1Y2GMT2_9FUNG|nr:E1-like protein-activating [Lobosporangium transversale]KAF9907923.1 Autophagy protein 7 [Lobosporangium transversale]ORZ16069.1 E1-like protein-activating [Lobosporangium transversale]|eukprot:XP_021881416.1 E1-like protein-activating [Lobosporangium transversale]